MVGWSPLGGRLATMQWPLFPSLFSFPIFFYIVYFSHRRSAQIKKSILQRLIGAPKYLGLTPFSDPISPFVDTWQPFLILQASVVYFSHRRRIQTYLAKVDRNAQKCKFKMTNIQKELPSKI